MDNAVDHNHGVSVNIGNNAQKVYFGDPVTSIRQVLKRYAQHKTWTSQSVYGPNGNRLSTILPNFPHFRGYDPNGIDNAATPVDPTPFTFAWTTPLHWFTVPFLTRRGSIRYKYVYTSDEPGSFTMTVTRNTENGSSSYGKGPVNTIDVTSDSTLASQAMSNSALNGWSGTHYTHVGFNPVLEVELPFATNRRFVPARKKTLIAAGDPDSQTHTLRSPLGSTAGATQVLALSSIGEDFSLSFFQSCPVFWRINNPTPSPTA
jgi:hypothetical protein